LAGALLPAQDYSPEIPALLAQGAWASWISLAVSRLNINQFLTALSYKNQTELCVSAPTRANLRSVHRARAPQPPSRARFRPLDRFSSGFSSPVGSSQCFRRARS